MYSQNSNLNLQLKIWLLSLIGLVILIILIGGLTRLTDSGLSITTWELFVGIAVEQTFQIVRCDIPHALHHFLSVQIFIVLNISDDAV